MPVANKAVTARMQELEELYTSLETALEDKHDVMEGRYANLESQMRMVMDMMSMMRQYVDVLAARPAVGKPMQATVETEAIAEAATTEDVAKADVHPKLTRRRMVG